MADWRMLLCVVTCLILSVSAAIPGGLTPGNVHDKEAQKVADFAVRKLDEMSNSMYKSKMMRLVDVKTQVVAGINYFLTFEMGETKCRKGEAKTGCKVNHNRVQKCHVTVWVQPWRNTRRVTDHSCTKKVSHKKDHSQKKPLGGSTRMNEDNQEVKKAADFAIEEMNKQTNSMYRLVLQDIMYAHRQTVSGIKYKLMVRLALSTCRNTEENRQASQDKCPAKQDSEEEDCKLTILHQAWQTPPYQLLAHRCQKVDPKVKTLQEKHKTHKKNKPTPSKAGQVVGSHEQFELFKKTYKKQYKTTQEEKQRFAIFRKNMRFVNKIQQKNKGTAKYGPTEFADMSQEEFRKTHLTPIWDTSYDPFLKPAEIPRGPIPEAFDWRDHQAVTAVKNQGQCGSCWAFSTTGNIEGQWFLKKRNLVSLSEQELVDCDKLDDGCEGGLPTNAYKEIIRLGGLETERQYPYEAEDEKCTLKVKKAHIYINSSVNISSSEADMAAWLVKNGPISIGINAFAMQFYMGGVSHPWSFLCNPDSLDHGVLIVGYGVEKGYFSDTPYWIIKNSWGPGWGEKGYYRIYRGGGTCGLNKMPTSAIVD